jgi:hypothetical protein
METNDFLELIDDKKNRIFPLHYKYIKSYKRIDKISQFINNDISVGDYQTNIYPSFLFHKPISKLI